MKTTPTLAENLRALFDDGVALLRKEIELARAELGEKLNQAQYGLVLIFVGLLLAAIATFLLAQALVAWLAVYLGHAGAALLSGVIILLAGLIALKLGASYLKAQNLKPVRTIRSTTETATRLKETIHDKIK